MIFDSFGVPGSKNKKNKKCNTILIVHLPHSVTTLWNSPWIWVILEQLLKKILILASQIKLLSRNHTNIDLIKKKKS